MPRDRRSTSFSASASDLYGHMRVPPRAGPSTVLWMAMMAFRPASLLWQNTTCSWPLVSICSKIIGCSAAARRAGRKPAPHVMVGMYRTDAKAAPQGRRCGRYSTRPRLQLRFDRQPAEHFGDAALQQRSARFVGLHGGWIGAGIEPAQPAIPVQVKPVAPVGAGQEQVL